MRITGLPAPLDLTGDVERLVADRSPGWPCRRCLHDADVGETLLLVSYDPWTVSSPYRQTGPVFVHERTCPPWSGDGLPEQQTSRLLSVRVMDEYGRQTSGDVVAGQRLLPVLQEIFACEENAFVHLHNAGPGCFAARVDRDGVGSQRACQEPSRRPDHGIAVAHGAMDIPYRRGRRPSAAPALT